MKTGFVKVELNKTIWEVPERYQQLAPIGSGAYGQVCSSLDTVRNFKVAIKKLARPFQSAIHAKRTYRELRLLKHMNHENVIGLLDVFTPSTTLDDFQDVYLVTHLMGSDLNNIVKTQRLSNDHVQFLVYQILRGLKYIHSAGIIHRDLKPSNIAVNEDCELKILDFGLARHAEVEMTGYVATRWYRAPEIMLNWMHYNQTVDIWSVGCIMAELLTSKTLFPGTDPIDQLTHIWSIVGNPDDFLLLKMTSEETVKSRKSSPQKSVCITTGGEIYIDQLTRIMVLCGKPDEEFLNKINSEEARNYIRSLPVMKKRNFKDVFNGANPDAINLLERMLELDADKRPTATEALAHPYLAQYADPSDEPIAEPYDESFEDKELSVAEWRRLIHKEVNMFEPQIRQIDAGISELAQDLQSRMKLLPFLPIFHYR